MNVNNSEVVCALKLTNVFSEKKQKSYPCVEVEFPNGSICKVFDNRLMTCFLSSVYFGEKGGDAN